MAKKSQIIEKTKELEDRLKRALADYANLQRRIEAEKDKFAQYGKILLLAKFLPALDVLESTERAAESADPALKKGLELTTREFKKILADEGVEEIATNSLFDPTLHEAVEVVAGSPEGRVVEVVEKGYRLGDRILRAAKVKVARREVRPAKPLAEKEIKAGDYA